MNKTRKPKLNVRLLRRIQKHILEEPNRFMMRLQFLKHDSGHLVLSDDYRETQSVPECGTVACIAGWALVLSKKYIRPESPWYSVGSRAAKLLGLSSDIGDGVFHLRYWPSKFRLRYNAARLPKERVKVAAARIEYLIKTGK